ncbi:TPA: HNH endonuclease [Klebsiella pneumoniae]|nr:HNH endonuclease [Klebsiella pneumoniae]
MIDFHVASSFLSYSPEDGQLRWKLNSNNTFEGMVAGCGDGKGYVLIGLGGVKYKAHRLAWLLSFGEWPPGPIDHINGIKSDNLLSNLRVASTLQNNRNSRSKGGASSFKGVDFHKAASKWRARIRVDGKRINIGHFSSERQAAFAYDFYALHYHGEFAKLNFA